MSKQSKDNNVKEIFYKETTIITPAEKEQSKKHQEIKTVLKEWLFGFLGSILFFGWFVFGLFFGTYYACSVHVLFGCFVLVVNIAFGLSVAVTAWNRALGWI